MFAFLQVPKTRIYAPLRTLGDLSYSTYLMHPFAWLIVSKSVPAALGGPLRMSCALLLTLLVAMLTYALVEKPANRLGQRWARSTLERHRQAGGDHAHVVADA